VLAILALIFVGFGYYRLKEYRFSPRVIWYAVEYGAEPSDIYIEPMPHDCDWEEAPKARGPSLCNGNGTFVDKRDTFPK
jgi:hypothetical protein